MTVTAEETAPATDQIADPGTVIRTPDQRVRVFISSTLQELAEERQAAREAITHLRLTPVLFELGARPHPPRHLYRAYLAQSDIFIGIYWQRYGWMAPGEEISGLEDEYHFAGDRPRLIYVKGPAPAREEPLQTLLDQIEANGMACYKTFQTPEELRELIENDLALMLTESFARGQTSVSSTPEAPVRPRHNLPVQRGVLVGRAEEVAEARDLLLHEQVGLLTVTGPGGGGKTRLALQVATMLAASFDDGVWLVPLASLTDPDLIPSAIAQALDIREMSGRQMLETVQDHLQDKHLLLVLDNFEHLLPAAWMASELLGRCPGLKILATSRSALRIRGEKELVLPPLALPQPRTLAEPQHIEQSPAVALFVERAREVNPSFTLSPETALIVAEICRRLDGLPLAIELAAARIKVLPPRALLARLDRRLPLLTGGARDLPTRQQTLHNTIAWSHDLLSDEEQTVFRRLAVFAGGFTLEAAESVCLENSQPQEGVPDPCRTLAGIQVLIDQSLLQPRGETGDEPRFGMLETIREYAHERLAESGETDSVCRRHAAHFAALAERAEIQLTGPEQEAWLNWLEAEHDNFRAALNWSQSPRGDVDLGLCLAGSLWKFWYVRCHLREGALWLQAMLAQTDERVTPQRATALRGAGNMAYAQRKYTVAAGYLERALAMCRELDDWDGEAACLNNLAVLRDEQGDMDGARMLHEQALSLRREMNDPAGIAITIGNLGALAHFERDHGRARTLYEEGLAIEREIGNIGGMAITLANLGELMGQQGDWSGAHSYLREGLALGARLGDMDVVTNCLDGLGHVAVRVGDHSRAAKLDGAAEAAREAIGSPNRPRHQEEYETHLREVRTALGEREFDARWAEGKAMSVDRAVALALGLPQAQCTG